jgi:proton-dependent oligopeptide transporter, POT family
MQLYDMLPNFIEEWTNSSDVVATLGLHEGQLARAAADPMLSRGLQVPQEWIINLDSGAIVLLVVFVSYVNRRLRRLVAISVGILLSAGGLLLCGITSRGWICLAGVLAFAIGEMTAGPKLYEYLGVIAPKGEEGLYMGYANIPFAIGWTLADAIGGVAYDRLADKANLALRYLGEHGLMAPDALAQVPRAGAMKALIVATHLDAQRATDVLWSTYHPESVWYPFVGLGIVTAVAMVLYARSARRWALENG